MCHLSDSAQSYLRYADSAPDTVEKEKCCGCADECLPEDLKGYTIEGLTGRFCGECITNNPIEIK